MATIAEAYQYWSTLNIDDLTDNCIKEQSTEIVSLNRIQMLDGLTSDGIPITPKYSENPFFKTPEKAKQYADWKMKISPKSNIRDRDTPNLFINGYFHSLLSFDQSTMSVKTGSEKLAKDVTDVHHDLLGLNKTSSGILAQEKILPSLLMKIRNALNI